MAYSWSESDMYQNYSNNLVLSWVVNAYFSPKSKISDRILGNNDDTLDKTILYNNVGYLQQGDFCAIMGSSGSGKTTLLNILTMREKNLYVESDIRINGKSIDFDELGEYSGYVKQNDIFIDVLTVKEWLTFQAFMRLGEDYSYEQKYDRVDEVLYECNITKIQDNLIGGYEFSKGISGGEKRLVSFATQVI
ncbi:unnamed protein product [Brachionus calyciflorus]|uniref:ABC transporter domain-containing protein n=1 Tax=Brachionus calyciflorus TaxID=104777 RepID=A0A814RDN6_9BILA|nr:unnamed protein product [Brachionus calyciflorus]